MNENTQEFKANLLTKISLFVYYSPPAGFILLKILVFVQQRDSRDINKSTAVISKHLLHHITVTSDIQCD